MARHRCGVRALCVHFRLARMTNRAKASPGSLAALNPHIEPGPLGVASAGGPPLSASALRDEPPKGDLPQLTPERRNHTRTKQGDACTLRGARRKNNRALRTAPPSNARIFRARMSGPSVLPCILHVWAGADCMLPSAPSPALFPVFPVAQRHREQAKALVFCGCSRCSRRSRQKSSCGACSPATAQRGDRPLALRSGAAQDMRGPLVHEGNPPVE